MINTLTLNPAIDHIFRFDRLEKNITNRVKSSAVSIGGKGTHVSINLSIMGTLTRAFGFSFGSKGKQIQAILAESGVEVFFIHGDEGESRDNYLIVEEETRDCTLIAEKGPCPSPGQLAAFLELLAGNVGVRDDLVLSGDVSNFSDQDVYSQVLDLLSVKNPRVFLDASGQSLHAGIRRRPFLIKPNLDELASLSNRKLKSQKDITNAILQLGKFGIEVIAVSLGSDGAIVSADDRLYRAVSPRVRVFNTVGCGDCFIAGLLHGFENNFDIEDTIRYAVAVSSAKAESPLSVGFDMRRAMALLEQVEIFRI